MTTRRVCDLDGTIIDTAADDFFTVTHGRTGEYKDICPRCSRSAYAVPAWIPSAPRAVGARVKATAEAMNITPDLVFDAVTAGVSASTEPSWPSTVGATVDDGTVTWVARPGPLGNAAVYRTLPPEAYLSMWGWVTGTDESAD